MPISLFHNKYRDQLILLKRDSYTFNGYCRFHNQHYQTTKLNWFGTEFQDPDHLASLVIFVLKKVSFVPLDLNRSCAYILCKWGSPRTDYDLWFAAGLTYWCKQQPYWLPPLKVFTTIKIVHNCFIFLWDFLKNKYHHYENNKYAPVVLMCICWQSQFLKGYFDYTKFCSSFLVFFF